MSDTLRPSSPVDLKDERPRVLLVDDDEQVGASLGRLLEKAGYSVTLVDNGNDAVHAVMSSQFSAILSDIHLPGTSGVELLRIVRAYDLDVPVILITGGPELQTAIQAVELGALEYLCKPIASQALIAVVSRAVRLREVARLKREALRLRGAEANEPGDLAGLSASLDRAIASLRGALQPVVSVRGQKIVAHELLLRSREPTLATPDAVLGAAEKLGRLPDLGRAMRRIGAAAIKELPEDTLLFVNVHPHDFRDTNLEDPGAPLGPYASRVVLELTERASLDEISDLGPRVRRLRERGFRFALDDLGAGHAGLGSFAHCEPEFVKLDMSLVRHIHRSEAKQRLVRGLFSLCTDLRSLVIAEGIESADEAAVLRELGCDLMQGYHFAKPGFGPQTVQW